MLLTHSKEKISNQKQTVKATEQCQSYSGPCQDIIVVKTRRKYFIQARAFSPEKTPCGHRLFGNVSNPTVLEPA